MAHIIKKIFMILLIIAVICGISFVVYRYKELKDSGKLEEVFGQNKNTNGELDPSTFVDSNSSSKQNVEDESSSEKSKTDDRQFVVQEKDYEGYYNKFVF